MNVARARAAAQAAGARTISIDDPGYPPLLRTIHDPPALLYVRGDPACLLEPQLAVVGSRRASAAGLRLASELSAQAVHAGLHICSGLALGIDGAAHCGALDAGGKSVAVMATGIEQIYPRRHRGLAGRLEQAGCLVSEFAPGTMPHKGTFPRRNRIISGLSLGVLVVEAALPSGSLITAGTAAEQGREVFALPWSVLHHGGRGCLQLIRDGAAMVQGIEDILQPLESLYELQQQMSPGVGRARQTAEPESALLALVGYEVTALDELVRLSGLPTATVLGELSALELEGKLARAAGGYVRC